MASARTYLLLPAEVLCLGQNSFCVCEALCQSSLLRGNAQSSVHTDNFIAVSCSYTAACLSPFCCSSVVVSSNKASGFGDLDVSIDISPDWKAPCMSLENPTLCTEHWLEGLFLQPEQLPVDACPSDLISKRANSSVSDFSLVWDLLVFNPFQGVAHWFGSSHTSASLPALISALSFLYFPLKLSIEGAIVWEYKSCSTFPPRNGKNTSEVLASVSAVKRISLSQCL